MTVKVWACSLAEGDAFWLEKEEWAILNQGAWNKPEVSNDTLRTGCKSNKKAREPCGSKLLYHCTGQNPIPHLTRRP